MSDSDAWPALPYPQWRDTCQTLHLWTQIVGKVRLVLSPPINHSWHTTLYVSSRGLTTSPIPHGTRTFEIEFDFLEHKLRIADCDGGARVVALRPVSVADFYGEVLAALRELSLEVKINTMPNELEDAIRFEQDRSHASYDAASAERFWRVLIQVDRVLKIFRSQFIGKSSPVHFFWGSFDMAVTRFSGRTAPEHPGGVPHLPDRVVREAYSHEVSSCGFWPGNDRMPEAAFYSYAYPEPAGFAARAARPDGAFYHAELKEFILPYDRVRQSGSPDQALLEFCQSTYEAAADCGRWPRAALERR